MGRRRTWLNRALRIFLRLLSGQFLGLLAPVTPDEVRPELDHFGAEDALG
jgi:hypothetical protein